MSCTTKEEVKNVYRQAREALNLTREEASDLLESVSVERINRIEREVFSPHPDEVLLMAERYKAPALCNYYCSEQCPIGQQYVPKIQLKGLSQIVLEVLASLNAMQVRTGRFVDIAADCEISDEELSDFVQIQKDLERISVSVETLQLWSEQMLATGKINMKRYAELLEK